MVGDTSNAKPHVTRPRARALGNLEFEHDPEISGNTDGVRITAESSRTLAAVSALLACNREILNRALVARVLSTGRSSVVVGVFRCALFSSAGVLISVVKQCR